MTTLKPIALFAFFSIIHLTCFSQTRSVLDSLENRYQACLDKGKNMFGCAKLFYQQMDSLLNVQYKQLRSSCDSVQKENLKQEQLKWLAKRDAYFKQTLNTFKSKNPKADPFGNAFGAQDDAMSMFDDNATFVKKRLLELIGKKPTDFSNNYRAKH